MYILYHSGRSSDSGVTTRPDDAFARNVHAFAKLLKSHPDEAVQAITIIGVGGVTTPEAVVRMIGAGATVVGSATILGRKGVGAFEELAKAFQN